MAVILRSRRATAVIDPVAGGRLLSLEINGVEVIHAMPATSLATALGADPAKYRDWYRGSFPLAPWAGSLHGGEFEFEGTRYTVESDAVNAPKHGVIAERIWDIFDHAEAEGRLTLSTPFGPRFTGGWPFEGYAVQSFVLDATSLTMRLEVHSSRDRMPAVAGFHPWFPRRIESGATADVEFNPTKRLVRSAGRRVASTDLGERPWDDLFVELRHRPRISWPGGPSLTLESDAPVWVYYERMPDGFCIEPWTGANGLDPEWTTTVVPGKPLKLNFTIRFA